MKCHEILTPFAHFKLDEPRKIEVGETMTLSHPEMPGFLQTLTVIKTVRGCAFAEPKRKNPTVLRPEQKPKD